MTLSPQDLLGVLAALGALMLAAHGVGWLFVRGHQPRVIGEILGGVLLGPSVLGVLAPGARASLLAGDVTGNVLGAVYELGLLLLLYVSGLEMRTAFPREDRRVAGYLTALGTALPFAAGLLLMLVVDRTPMAGASASVGSLMLVVGAAVAVTSIPVISRIMLDLGIMETRFARVVLTVAVLEDIVLYAVVAVALGVAAGSTAHASGLPDLLGIPAASAAAALYHAVATLGLFALGVGVLRPLLGALRSSVGHLADAAGPAAVHIMVLIGMSGLAVMLGVAPMFGAFVAGMAATRNDSVPSRSHAAIKQFASAFFIPVYFAIVGARIDVFGGFDLVFAAAFITFACVVKSASVYAGAALAGEGRRAAVNLAVALNARGGPGIVLASLAFDAGIVSSGFYTTLVLMAVVTSLAAGAWLARELRAGRPLVGSGEGR